MQNTAKKKGKYVGSSRNDCRSEGQKGASNSILDQMKWFENTLKRTMKKVFPIPLIIN
jgi:hypothetical protein